MDRFDAMQAFVRVVETGSFTKAAQTLHMSKTTVTQLVQQLEARLRVKLLNRTTRQVHVTADGAAYYERAVRLLVDLDDAETSLSSATTAPRGRLRVDVPSPLARMLLVPAFLEFHARYPDLQIEMGVSDRLVDLIGDNVDCVIRGGELSDQSLVARRIANIEFVTVATPDYLARHGTPQHPRDLESGHRNVIYFSPVSLKRYPLVFHKDGEVIEITNPSHLAINEGSAYTTAVLSSQGIGQISRFQAHTHLNSGALVRLLEDWKEPPLPIYVVYPPNSHLSAKVRAFVDWVVELFSDYPHL